MPACAINILERVSMSRKTRSRELIVSVALISVVALGGCSRKTSQEYFSEAQNYHAKGDNKSAVIELKNALQKDPNNGDARFLLGEIYSETGDYAAAEDELQMAMQFEKYRKKVQIELGNVYLGRGEFQKVIDNLKPEAGMDAQTRAEVLAMRGSAYMGLGKNDEASAAFAESLKTSPDFQDALLGEARLAASQKKLDDALKIVDQILAKDPKSTKAWLMKGDLLRAQSNNEKAVEAYDEILKFDETNIPARVSLASIDLSMGRLDDAQKEIDKIDKLKPDNLMGKYLQALLYFRQSKFTNARDELQQVLKSAPDHMPSVLLMGAIDYSLNSLEEAQKNLNHFIDAFPSNDYARRLLASTQLKLKQPQDAIKTLAPLLGSLNPDVQTQSLAAEAYIQLGDYTKAAERLERVNVLQPNNADARTMLGLSRVAKGQTDQAISDFEAAAKLNPEKFNADTALALTYLGKKQYDKALAVAKSMAAKQPDNPIFYNLGGAAYLGMNDVANARASFEKSLKADAKYAPAAINLGLLDLRAKDFAAAKKDFEGVLAIDKNNLQAMMMLAGIAQNSGNDKEELDWLNSAVKANPSVLQPRNALVSYYLAKKDVKSALDAAQAAATAMPKDPEALDLLGGTQVAAGNRNDALATYQNLIKLVPRSPLAYYRLATVQMMLQDNPSAAASLAKALELKPDFLDADTALMSLDVRSKNYNDALKIARDVQSRLPKSPVGLYMEGDIMMAQRQYGEAVGVYQKAQKLAPSTVGVMKLHSAMTFSGNAKRADAMLLGWVKAHASDMLARRYLAETYMREGNAGQAVEQFDIVLKANPDDVESLNNLALLYQQQKNPQAEELARRAYKLAPDSPQIMDTLGWILVGKSDIKNGLELLQKAASLLPGAPDIHYHYAVALAKSGDKTRARQELNGILNSGLDFPDKREAQTLLGQL